MFTKIFMIVALRLRETRLSLHAHIKKRYPIRIGRRCRIHRYVTLDASKGQILLHDDVMLNRYVYLLHNVEIGKGSQLNHYTRVDGWGGVKIGNDVIIGPNVQILSYQHNYKQRSKTIKGQGITKKPVVIEDDVWIGASAVVLSGIHIGRGAVIGAGAVVTKDVEEFSVVVGVPAKRIGSRE